ncbi:MAG: T-protein of glycine cleavage system [Candidatus Scalindua rubra]|uniref:Aminomethyltransferase n=1 Tax=Candidatus Scalindua rubra TaxID=1872076 RepID=A0A1E3XDF7_9BACT|nr:MAG: T-protein of glycine cleavage system [Candidatus Scalindua rubra]
MINSNKKTPLYEVHLDFGAKIVDYHNFLMPLQYSSIIHEHKNVRNNAGLFDISHMGEIAIMGKGATEFVQRIITNDVSNLPNYKAAYTPICDDEGGIIDDIVVFKYNPEKYMLVVNCANTNKDNKWINKFKTNNVNINNLSDQISLLAVQGPKSEDIIRLVFGEECTTLSRFQFMEITVGEMQLTVSRTGYTGEDGFEIFVNNSHCVDLWNILLEKGKDTGLEPAGLGARNTLRLEAGYLLYGNDIDDSITPLEANLGWTVKFNKSDFIGKDSLLRLKKYGLKRMFVAFKLLDKGIPRTNNGIIYHNNVIGKVTSGTFSPTLEIGIGFGYVLKHIAEHKSRVSIRIRDTDFPAKIVNTPFITKKGS